MAALKGFQKAYLRGLGHALRPLIHVGKHGVTPALEKQTTLALDHNELIKLRFLDRKGERHELAAGIAGATGAEVAGMIGNTALLYRQQPDVEKRAIKLPTRAQAVPTDDVAGDDEE